MKESEYGGYYCNNYGCPLDGLIEPVLWSTTIAKIKEYQFKNNICVSD